MDVQPIVLDQSQLSTVPERVRDMWKELQTWDWIYGQTPEFTNQLEHDFNWGRVVRSMVGTLPQCFSLLLTRHVWAPLFRRKL